MKQPPSAVFPVAVQPRCWSFSLPFLPPGINHQYQAIGHGRKALTAEAKEARQHITLAAQRAGFTPEMLSLYGVRVTFTMAGWSGDIDGPIKSLLDAVFVLPGHRTAWDHRIIRLEVDKRVEPGQRQTDVTIWTVTE